MIRLAVPGCRGRMGGRIVALASAEKDFKIAALIERAGHPDLGIVEGGIAVTDSLTVAQSCDVMIDFTTPESTMANLAFCRDHGVKMVIGTTGLSPAQEAEIARAGASIAVVYSSNMSIGVNLLFKLAEMLAASVPVDYTVHLTEAHHIHKKDAPSGTAKTLARIIEAGTARTLPPIESIREGEIVGDHDVCFESSEDVLVIRHHAKNRDIFVKGALKAAKFLSDKASGAFSMQDVLGLTM